MLWTIQKVLLYPTVGAVIDITVASVRKRQSFVVFVKKLGIFYTIININFSPVHFFPKILTSYIPLCFVLYLLMSCAFCLFLLLYCLQTTKLNCVILWVWPDCLYSFWQSQKVWYFHYLTQRQVGNFGILSTLKGGPTLRDNSAPRSWGVARIILSLKTVSKNTASWLNQSLKESTFWLAQKK